MLCSNCSEVIRPVVAFDIDGTMGDYHTHFLVFAYHYLDMGSSGFSINYDYMGDQPFSEWFMSRWNTDYRTWQDIKLAYRQGAQKRSMPQYPLTQLARRAYNEGVEVWVTTTRPYLRHDGIDPDTREWLRRHAIEYDGLIYSEDKYVTLAERVDPERVIAVFDDLPEMYDDASLNFGPNTPFLVKTRWNRLVSRQNEGDHTKATMHFNIRLASWRSVYDERATA